MSNNPDDVSADLADDESGSDLLRLWFVDDTLHCSLQLAEEDPVFWGGILGELTRHIADALAEETELSPEEAFVQIREALQKELDSPGDGE